MSQVSAATQIGTGSVQGSGALNTNIMWDDAIPGTASGTINGIAIKAKIQPTLNMIISGSGEIDLGTLTSAGYGSGTVSIEIGTNAANGAAVTAKSTNGGLKSGTDYINNLTTDGLADNYQFSSALGAATDSSFSGTINQVFYATTEINSTSTTYPVYSSAKPQATTGVNDILFTVAAKPNAQTPAGIYTDVVILTVTGTF